LFSLGLGGGRITPKAHGVAESTPNRPTIFFFSLGFGGGRTTTVGLGVALATPWPLGVVARPPFSFLKIFFNILIFEFLFIF
jgi:hypothetical protein